jgi:hypothetical protein
MPNPSELQRADEDSREAWRNREETEHAPRDSRSRSLSLSEAYEEACDNANDLHFSKATREGALREARRLAEELGIEGPPPINGRSAARLYVAKDIKLSSIERSLLIDALLYCGIMTDGRESVRVSLIERLRALD